MRAYLPPPALPRFFARLPTWHSARRSAQAFSHTVPFTSHLVLPGSEGNPALLREKAFVGKKG